MEMASWGTCVIVTVNVLSAGTPVHTVQVAAVSFVMQTHDIIMLCYAAIEK